MHFCALRQKPLATALAAARESGPAGFGLHARAKAMLAFPGALGSL
jgi:hypothetical protein